MIRTRKSRARRASSIFSMARLLCTIWALILNGLGVPIFKTCFANATEDDYGEPLTVGPPITSFLFAAGVYVILDKLTLYPQSFRRPGHLCLCFYEFLATAFLLEFSTACIWTPIDVLVLTTLPKAICHILQDLGYSDAAETFLTNKSSMAAFTYGFAISFLLVALHVTKTVDYTIITDCGPTYFGSHLKNKFLHRMQSELGNPKHRKKCTCKTRRKDRSKSRVKDHKP